MPAMTTLLFEIIPDAASWPTCRDCCDPIDPRESEPHHNGRCYSCFITRLERTYYELWLNHGRGRILRRLSRLARTGR